jgi:hypothetical protein
MIFRARFADIIYVASFMFVQRCELEGCGLRVADFCCGRANALQQSGQLSLHGVYPIEAGRLHHSVELFSNYSNSPHCRYVHRRHAPHFSHTATLCIDVDKADKRSNSQARAVRLPLDIGHLSRSLQLSPVKHLPELQQQSLPTMQA